MGDLGTRLATDEPFAYNTLVCVFRYLSFKDLLNCAQVCPIWQWIVDEDTIWKHITVYCCAKHIGKSVDLYGPKIRNLEILNPRFIALEHFRELCLKMENLQRIALHGCHNNQLGMLAVTNKRLERIYAEIYWGRSELEFLMNFSNLTHLELVTHSTISEVLFLPKLKKIKHLTLFAPCEESIWDDIVKIETLESLSVDTDLDSTWISALFETNFLIRHFKRLKKLQISDLPYFHEYDILDKIKLLPNIKELVLDNVSISRAGMSNFGSLLGQCRNLESFTISINRVVFYDSILDVALENFEILNGVITLKDNLKYFCWLMDYAGISKAEGFYEQPNITALKIFKTDKSKQSPKRVPNSFHSIEGVVPITLPKLLKLFQKRLPSTDVILLDHETIRKIKKEKCCYECKKMIMTPQDRMKSYS